MTDDQVEYDTHQDAGTISTKGNPACGHCHLIVARYASQVIAASGIFHRECFEAWFLGRYGKRPTLRPGNGSDRHRFLIIDTSRKK